MLRTLRLRFRDRPDYDLAFEAPGEEPDPRQALRDLADDDGRISLGDRESCLVDDVLDVSLVEPTQIETDVGARSPGRGRCYRARRELRDALVGAPAHLKSSPPCRPTALTPSSSACSAA